MRSGTFLRFACRRTKVRHITSTSLDKIARKPETLVINYRKGWLSTLLGFGMIDVTGIWVPREDLDGHGAQCRKRKNKPTSSV
jgi:hypothetical protein